MFSSFFLSVYSFMGDKLLKVYIVFLSIILMPFKIY